MTSYVTILCASEEDAQTMIGKYVDGFGYTLRASYPAADMAVLKTADDGPDTESCAAMGSADASLLVFSSG